METVLELITKIQKSFMNNPGDYHPFIEHIRFPLYKNLKSNTRIDFKFPLTVLIGPNGSGKSSVLHALYGCPRNYNTGDYWFGTNLDPIKEGGRHRYIYGYSKNGEFCGEVRYARFKRSKSKKAKNPKRKNLDYWETSKPAVNEDEMKGDRISPVVKEVIYKDFRAELGAFDKYFYFDEGPKSSYKKVDRKYPEKQDYIRAKAKHLKKIFDETEKEIPLYGKSQNDELENLSKECVKHISWILNKDYTHAQWVNHSFYSSAGNSSKAVSVRFQTKRRSYSEAFAGSGEMSITAIVKAFEDAQPNSLIILDEPEVSLYPGAQKRLQLYILKQILQKKHQVVISTHSPILVEGLPSSAIKSCIPTEDNQFDIVETDYYEAFYFIEHSQECKIQIRVEDKLAKLIIDSIIDKKFFRYKDLFNVFYIPGGESIIKKDMTRLCCQGENVYLYFDGDQKFDYKNWKEVKAGDLTVKKYEEIIEAATNLNIKKLEFPLTSGDTDDMKKKVYQNF